MQVELHRPDEPDVVLASVEWTDGQAVISSDDEALVAALVGAFRHTPVVVDDASYRRLGTSGDVQIHPGSLEWFRAVVQARVPAETGLIGRLVPGVSQGGFDPAAGYRTFEDSIERLTK
jgi:hypothetical protein